MRFLILITLLLLPLPTYAQIVSVEGFCKALPEYRQEEGVEFQPGADDVVPADLNALKTPILNRIDIPVSVDLGQRFSLDIPADIELKPDIAMIKIYPDGRVEYNGQDITSQAYAACAEDASPGAETADGQVGTDTVKSEAENTDATETADGEVLEGQYP